MRVAISSSKEFSVYGRRGRLGAIVPANNSVIEPEWWSVMPEEVALYATRILTRGDLTPEAVRGMEKEIGRAIYELVATGVDVVAYCDMVTTFIMERSWNEAKMAEIERSAGVASVSAWTALREALKALGIRRFALGTPYPKAIHHLARGFFEAEGYEIVIDATLDIVQMRDVPKVSAERLSLFVDRLRVDGADAIVLLATDLPSFASIAMLEDRVGMPILTSNQTLLWRALRLTRNKARISSLGRLFDV